MLFSYAPFVETGSLVVWLFKPNTVFLWVKPDVTVRIEDVKEMTSKLSYREIVHQFGGVPMRFLHQYMHLEEFDQAIRMEAIRWAMSMPKESIEAIRIQVAPKSLFARATAASASTALSLVGYDIKVVDDIRPELVNIEPFFLDETLKKPDTNVFASENAASVEASVEASVKASVKASVEASVEASVDASVDASVEARTIAESGDLQRPFAHAPFVETNSIVVWLMEPNTVCTWVKPNAHVTLECVQEMTRQVSYRELLHLFGEGQFRFLHNFSNVETFDKKVRMELVKWGMSYPKESISAFRIKLSPSQKSLVAMAASAATVALNLVGYDQKIVDDLTPELKGTTPFVILEDPSS